ncbi:hypothetical protein [Croceicoccus sp. YJ47]|uniref:hypothetical protein n=1 Tax=Croceicoccus sp. YJ47 TaxID=2798724 RepID=UPI001921A5F5|nr:hypothetical protein [Croceicoccus sp. YJ47]QQN73968.1 hypothetical protein JD971_14665 [Croceicoccus sp. YJ47]
MMDWQTAPATGLEEMIAKFKATLPGWWFRVCECQVSADASCAPTSESEHIALLGTDERFDSGFDADLPQPATMAEALECYRKSAWGKRYGPTRWFSPCLKLSASNGAMISASPSAII